MNRRDEHLTAVIRDLDPERDPARWPEAAPIPEHGGRRRHVPLLAAVAVVVVAAGVGVGAVRTLTSGETPAATRPAVTPPVPEQPYDPAAVKRTGGCLAGMNTAAILDHFGLSEGEPGPDAVVREFERTVLVNDFSGRNRRAITSVAAVQLRRTPGVVEATYFSPEGLPVAGATVDRTGKRRTWVLSHHWACAVGPGPAEPSPTPALPTQSKP